MVKSKISIVIPTLNRIDTLKRTLDSFEDGYYKPDQVIVIDQSDSIEVREQIKKLCFSYSFSIDYFYSKIKSSTQSRNFGFSFCKNEIVIFCDDDIIVQKDTIKNINELFGDSNLALLAGLNINYKKAKSQIGYILGFKSFRKRKEGHVTKSVLGRFPSKIYVETKTSWAMGFFFVVRKSLVDKWNVKFDEKLTSYAYAEDLDFTYNYCQKARMFGYGCKINPLVKVKHLESQEYRVPSRTSTFMYVLNRYYLSKKHNMGKSSLFWMWVTNNCIYLHRLFKKENPKDMKDAMKYLRKHKKEVSEGKFYYGE